MALYELNGITVELPEETASEKVHRKLASGDYERREAEGVLARIRPGMRVLELGGGLGYVTALCARRAGAQNVTCVEANPQALPLLRKTLELNGYDAVDLRHGAVVGEARKGPVSFRMGKAIWGSGLAEGSAAEREGQGETLVEVPALPLRKLLRQVRPQAVVMDVEGAEAELFLQPWPGHVRVVLMELHPRLYGDRIVQQIFDCMSVSGLTYDPAVSYRSYVGFRRVKTG